MLGNLNLLINFYEMRNGMHNSLKSTKIIAFYTIFDWKMKLSFFILASKRVAKYTELW